MATQIVNCPHCFTPNDTRNATCSNCGSTLNTYGGPMQQVLPANTSGKEKKLLAGLLGIFLGGLGVHKFVLGYTTEGIIMAAVYVVGLFLCGLPALAISIVGIVEGIIYLTKSDEEFVQTYIVNKKAWF